MENGRKGGGVTAKAAKAAGGRRLLTSITLPAGLTSLGEWAFSRCSSMVSIELPAGLTSLGGYAFYGCSSLTSIQLFDVNSS